MTRQGRPPLCKICGAKLDAAMAYKVVTITPRGREIRAFYCSQNEYETNYTNITQKVDVPKREKKARLNKEKETKAKKENPARDAAYSAICGIIGRKRIVNTILWKEWKLWNEVATDEVIAQYLEENQQYLTSVVAKLEDKEFNRIRYLSAIIKNNLNDFMIKVKVEDKPIVQVDETFYAPVKTRNNKRRSLADLEDEL